MNYFRRGRAAQDTAGQTVEMGPPALPSQAEVQQSSPRATRRPNFFDRRRQNETSDAQSPVSQQATGPPDESPKTPRFQFSGLPSLPSHRLHFPWSRNDDGADEASNQGAINTGSAQVGQQGGDLDIRPLPALPQPVDPGHMVGEPGPRRFSGPDPAELRLAQLADDGRRRRQRGGPRGLRLGRLEYVRPGCRPKNFLFCLPWIESRRMRMLILQSFVSGVFSALMLATYLALSFSQNLATSEFSILLILIILISAAFFCHTVIRILLLIYRPRAGQNGQPGVQRIGGYAVPEEPIRVVLARDEDDLEQADDEAAPKKPKPPPYGAWRQSIRVDPDRIYWQRNPDAQESEAQGMETRRTGTATGPRPPSYVSEDGVDYVVDARPRSVAPGAFAVQVEQVQAPLPIHPSEAGRWNGQSGPWRV